MANMWLSPYGKLINLQWVMAIEVRQDASADWDVVATCSIPNEEPCPIQYHLATCESREAADAILEWIASQIARRGEPVIYVLPTPQAQDLGPGRYEVDLVAVEKEAKKILADVSSDAWIGEPGWDRWAKGKLAWATDIILGLIALLKDKDKAALR